MEIIEQLERMAAAMPWDRCDIWISREPEGQYKFTAYVPCNDKFGFESVFGRGDTPLDAVDDVIKQAGVRLPESARDRKIEELKAQIAKLQSVVIGMPPYRPNRELSEGKPTIQATGIVDV